MKEVVLKRLFVEKGEHVRRSEDLPVRFTATLCAPLHCRSGEREIYFGSILQHRHHIARLQLLLKLLKGWAAESIIVT